MCARERARGGGARGIEINYTGKSKILAIRDYCIIIVDPLAHTVHIHTRSRHIAVCLSLGGVGARSPRGSRESSGARTARQLRLIRFKDESRIHSRQSITNNSRRDSGGSLLKTVRARGYISRSLALSLTKVREHANVNGSTRFIRDCTEGGEREREAKIHSRALLHARASEQASGCSTHTYTYMHTTRNILPATSGNL